MTDKILKRERSYNGRFLICDQQETTPLLQEENIVKGGTETGELTRSRAITLVGTSLLINVFSFGFSFCLSVFYPEFVRVFDSERSVTALVQSLFMAFIFAGGVLWHPFVIKYGPARSMLCGATMVSVAVFIAQFATNVWVVLLFLGVIAGVGSSIPAIGPFILVNQIMGKWKKGALAMIPTGASIGQFCFTYLAEYLIEEYNWSGALLIMSGIIANMIPCCIVIYFIEKESINKAKRENSTSNPKLFDRDVFKEWRLYPLLLNALFLAFSVFVESKFLVDLMILKGFDRATGSLFVSYIGLANFAGRIVASILKLFCLKGHSLFQVSFLILLNAASRAIILLSDTYSGLLAGAILNGFSFGLCVPNLAIMMLEVFRADLYGPVFSIYNIFGGIGNFLGGYLGGYIEDSTDNYDILFQIAIVFSVFMALSFFIIGISVTKHCKNVKF